MVFYELSRQQFLSSRWEEVAFCSVYELTLVPGTRKWVKTTRTTVQHKQSQAFLSRPVGEAWFSWTWSGGPDHRTHATLKHVLTLFSHYSHTGKHCRPAFSCRAYSTLMQLLHSTGFWLTHPCRLTSVNLAMLEKNRSKIKKWGCIQVWKYDKWLKNILTSLKKDVQQSQQSLLFDISPWLTSLVKRV